MARIMIVEDERIVARDLEATLLELEYAVAAIVGTGEDAVSTASEEKPDLILMDIRLAGAMDGVEAATRIKGERDVPIIFLTSHSDRETLRRATLAAPLGYLVKPFEPIELRCAIEVALYRHEIDARLREREQWLATTLRSIGEGVVATDAFEKVTFVNAVAETLTGWTHAEAVGQDIARVLALLDESTSTPVESPVRIALREKTTTVSRRDVLVHRGGATVPVGDSAAPILDTTGAAVGGVVVFRDISEQRRAEQEISSLNASLEARVVERTRQLESANTELEAFVYSVAHDLRAPLRGIDRFSEALVEDHLVGLAPEALDHLHRIRRATQRMAQLISDLLSLASIAKRELQLSTVDVSRFAHEIVDGLRAKTSRDVVVRVQAGVRAEADHHLLRTVLANLLDNAWKYTAKTAGAMIEVGVEVRDGKPVYFVRDNGVGFDLARANRLFGAFQRFHSEAEFEGNGVGLAVAQRIIHRHGGRIWAEAEVGRGATFFFSV